MNADQNMERKEMQNEAAEKEFRIRLCFVRHGETAGNLEKRYVGRTDEPLCAVGRENVRRLGEIKKDIWNLSHPQQKHTFRIYVSPMRRCLETAALLFPGAEDSFHVIPDFRECDFGLFENRNYRELSGDPELAPIYQAWIDSGGTLAFPAGESPEGFRKRCVHAFGKITAPEAGEGDTEKTMVFVVHGGTIMSILAAYGEPKKGYYDYQVPCTGGYLCDYLPGRGVIKMIAKL